MGGPAATPLSEGPDPGQGGPEKPRPNGNPEPLEAQGPDVVDKGEPDPMARVRTMQKPVYYVSEVLHEQMPGILRRISLSMPYLLHLGNCATIFRHTELS